jgi:hypothetical protein
MAIVDLYVTPFFFLFFLFENVILLKSKFNCIQENDNIYTYKKKQIKYNINYGTVVSRWSDP